MKKKLLRSGVFIMSEVKKCLSSLHDFLKINKINNIDEHTLFGEVDKEAPKELHKDEHFAFCRVVSEHVFIVTFITYS